jgi:hypothetical protein
MVIFSPRIKTLKSLHFKSCSGERTTEELGRGREKGGGSHKGCELRLGEGNTPRPAVPKPG